MAPSTIRKAIGAVKDQTSIGIAKVSSNTAPELEVAIVKATSHDDEPAEERHIRDILTLSSYSLGYVNACVVTVSKRLGKTRDWIVALKALMLVHRLLADGDPSFQQEILYATRRGTRLLNMSDFRDEAHSSSWDHSAFVRTFALFLDQRLECMVYERKQSGGGGEGSSRDGDRRRPHSDDGEFDSYNGNYGRSYGDYGNEPRRDERTPPRRQQQQPVTPIRDIKTERVLGRMHHLQQLLDRFLACRPTGTAKNSRLVLIALYLVVKESFQLYADICEILAVLLDRFFDMEYAECVKSFEAYASAAKQIDELAAFYTWCKDMGVCRTSEYPDVQRITDKLLETLEEFMRDRGKRPKSPENKPVPAVEAVREEPEPDPDMNSIKALPAPSDYEESPKVEKPQEPAKPQKEPEADLLNLREDAVSADDQGNRLALALFSAGGSGANAANGSWEAFPSNSESEVTSAWQTPAAETGKADWELALVETASNLSKQKAALAGGFDPLLLNGMYDQGAVRQHTSVQINSGGSGSSVALPMQNKTPVLALPAPDSSVQTVGQDPFAASLSVPPPSYVQMSDMEKKQQLLVQEHQLWQNYARDGMQGQVSLTKMSGNGFYTTAVPPVMPYGMPLPPVNGGGYYYPPH